MRNNNNNNSNNNNNNNHNDDDDDDDDNDERQSITTPNKSDDENMKIKETNGKTNNKDDSNNNDNKNLKEKDEEDEEIKRLRIYYRKLLFSKILENKGSTARDHLANERTYLAWLRTALGSIGLGVALAKLSTENTAAGIIFVSLGSLILLYSPLRYFQVYRQLLNGKFSPNFWGIIVFIILAVACAITALVVVLTK